MSQTTQYLIIAGLVVACVAILGLCIVNVARSDRASQPEHPGATADWDPADLPGELAIVGAYLVDPEEQAALDAATDRIAATVTAEVDDRRHLVPGWHDLIQPAPMPQLFAEPAHELPVVLGRGRHHEDTVEIVPAGWMPPIGARRLAALLDDTQGFQAVRDGH